MYFIELNYTWMSNYSKDVEFSGNPFDIGHIGYFGLDYDFDCDCLSGGEVGGRFDFSKGAFS